jgi:hypothetical protein
MDIIVIGGLPKPIGGVTSFIYRLANTEKISEIIDIYPNTNKQIPPRFLGKITIVNGYWGLFDYFLRKLIFAKNVFIHFNFSTARALNLIKYLPKNSSQKWGLMLHHGDLSLNNTICGFGNCLSKFDIIFCLNATQRSFYLQLGCPGGKLKQCSSFIPIDKPEWNTGKKNFIDAFFSDAKPLVASGYAEVYYNHEWCIRYVKQHLEEKLALFLYGDIATRNPIRELVDGESRIRIYEDCDQDIFNYALSRAKVYLRPTMKDSFGIAVADAISFGVDVLASDICPRYPGTHLFSPLTYNSFELALSGLLGYIAEKPRISTADIEPFSYSNIF